MLFTLLCMLLVLSFLMLMLIGSTYFKILTKSIQILGRGSMRRLTGYEQGTQLRYSADFTPSCAFQTTESWYTCCLWVCADKIYVTQNKCKNIRYFAGLVTGRMLLSGRTRYTFSGVKQIKMIATNSDLLPRPFIGLLWFYYCRKVETSIKSVRLKQDMVSTHTDSSRLYSRNNRSAPHSPVFLGK
jgi:hypothetical protein